MRAWAASSSPKRSVAGPPVVPVLQRCSRSSLGQDKPCHGRCDASGSLVPAVVDDVITTPGEPIADHTRRFMESRFGRDFSQVRIHTDAQAARSAAAVGARAYTVGTHVAFGAGQYTTTRSGQELIAHELAHVVQQAAGRAGKSVQRQEGELGTTRPTPPSGSGCLARCREEYRRCLGATSHAGCLAGLRACEARCSPEPPVLRGSAFPKLLIGGSQDAYEREADDIARRVVDSPAAVLVSRPVPALTSTNLRMQRQASPASAPCRADDSLVDQWLRARIDQLVQRRFQTIAAPAERTRFRRWQTIVANGRIDMDVFYRRPPPSGGEGHVKLVVELSGPSRSLLLATVYDWFGTQSVPIAAWRGEARQDPNGACHVRDLVQEHRGPVNPGFRA